MKKLIIVVNLVLACVVFLASRSPAQSARAAPGDLTFSVNDQSDAIDNNLGDGVCLAANGKCTLRAAIQEANVQYAAHPGAMYTISVPGAFTFFSPPRLYALSITGSGEDNATTGDLDIKSNLLIRTTNGQPALVSAAAIGDRVFHVIQPPSGPISVTFLRIWIANGTATDGNSASDVGGGGLLIQNKGSVTLTSGRVLSNTVLSPAGKFGTGGGIYQTEDGGTLTLNNMIIGANKVLAADSGFAIGGGVGTFGRLVVNDSTIISNVVTFEASAASVSGRGGGIEASCCLANSSFEINHSAVLNNAVVVRGAPNTGRFGLAGGIDSSVPTTVTDSTIRGNLVSANGDVDSAYGGGLVAAGTLLMVNSMVADNRLVAASAPFIVYAGGGMSVFEHSRIISSTVTGNSVKVGSTPSGKGGGISVNLFSGSENVLLDRSVVELNIADEGGGTYSTGPHSLLVVRNSTVNGNVATSNGAGIFNGNVLTVTNSTFYFNVANKDGGGLYNANRAHVDSATFNSNAADTNADNSGDGGGIFVQSGATLFLRNSLLTGNADLTVSGPVLTDCAGTIISLDYNLIEHTPSGCSVIGATANNKLGTFPNVVDTTLQNNGGATPTLALPPGSAAINGGDPAGCKDEKGNALTTDQRGFARVGACDIGAFEFGALPPRLYLPLIVR